MKFNGSFALVTETGKPSVKIRLVIAPWELPQAMSSLVWKRKKHLFAVQTTLHICFTLHFKMAQPVYLNTQCCSTSINTLICEECISMLDALAQNRYMKTWLRPAGGGNSLSAQLVNADQNDWWWNETCAASAVRRIKEHSLNVLVPHDFVSFWLLCRAQSEPPHKATITEGTIAQRPAVLWLTGLRRLALSIFDCNHNMKNKTL